MGAKVNMKKAADDTARVKALTRIMACPTFFLGYGMLEQTIPNEIMLALEARKTNAEENRTVIETPLRRNESIWINVESFKIFQLNRV